MVYNIFAKFAKKSKSSKKNRQNYRKYIARTLADFIRQASCEVPAVYGLFEVFVFFFVAVGNVLSVTALEFNALDHIDSGVGSEQ